MSIEETTGLGPLYAALAKAQGAIRGAEKDRTNPQFRQGYATLASVWDACRAALSANGLSVTQATDVDAEGHVVLRTTLCHASGGSVTGTYPVRPTQDTPQAHGSALTYARRYCLAAMVGVAPEDDDGEAASKAPPRPDVPALAARLSAATTPEALRAAEEDVRAVWGALGDKDRKDLTTYRDAARERLAKKQDTPEQAAQRAEIAASLRKDSKPYGTYAHEDNPITGEAGGQEDLPDEPPSDDQQALALTERLAKATTLAEYDALWAVIQTSPEWRAATEGARGIAALNVAALRPAIAEQPKKGGRK